MEAADSTQRPGAQVFEFGPFRLDVAGRVLERDDVAIALTPKAFDTLVALVDNAGRLVGKEELLERIWPGTFVQEATLAQNVFQLRKILGDGYIDTVPKHGYRFAGSVRRVAVDRRHPSVGPPVLAPPEPSVDSSTVDSEGVAPEVARISARPATFAVVLVASLTASLVVFFALRARNQVSAAATSSTIGRAMLAVLPFQNLSDDPEQEYFSDGLTEEVTTQLARMQPDRLAVVARTSAMTFRGSTKNAQQIGRELSAEYLLEGSVRRDQGRVRISVQLIRSSNQSHIWADTYEGDLRNVFGLQDDVARAVAAEMRGVLHVAAREEPRRARAVDERTYLQYLNGRYHLARRTPEQVATAIEYLNEAVEADPAFAPAFAALAEAYSLLGSWDFKPPDEMFPRAADAARRALELDAMLGEAHASLGFILLTYDRNPSGAERELREAIRVSPGYSTAHHWLALHQLSSGRFDSAIEEIRTAESIDPLSLIVHSEHGWILDMAGRHAASIEELKNTVAMDPSFSRSHFMLALAYEHNGELDAALTEFKSAMTLSDENRTLASIARIYAAKGQRKDSNRLVGELQRRAGHEALSPYFMARLSVALGNPNEAFAWLEKGYRTRATLNALPIDPDFEPLRSDRRYTDLVARIGFAP
jgi:TolB-like protein/DNA-binding winged helix-turn-helix (wHTH) protein/Tfp pilus assembly protein PilF